MRLSQAKRSSRWSITMLASLASLAFMPVVVRGDIQCIQYGADTFHVGSTIKFQWTDTGSYPIDTFNLNFYCYENGILIRKLATLSDNSTQTSMLWTVEQSIMDTLSECSLNQYQGRYDWTYNDPVTGTPTNGSASCKSILLVGPGVAPPLGSSPLDPQPTDDPSTPDQIEITDKTKMVVIGVGCSAGFLILAGFIGFYIIRYKNKHAEEKLANEKLREPSSRLSDEENHDISAGIYRGVQYEAVSKSEIPDSASQSFLAGSQAYVTDSHVEFPSTSNNRTSSILTSPFTPQDENSRKLQQQEQQYIDQLQYQQQHQQQHQEQQLNYGGY